MGMNGIGWVDFSSDHRSRIWSALDLLAKPGVIDELGIGPVRDALADTIFPGISTIQTRPKYFSLVPLLLKQYQEQELRRRRPIAVDEFLMTRERQCRAAMVRAFEESTERDVDGSGIIGATFGEDLDRGVVRRPSSIYWNGLRTFRIFAPPELSLTEFGKRLIGSNHSRIRTDSATTGDDIDAEGSLPDAYVMTAKVGDQDMYWHRLSIELLPVEGEFIQQQIISSQPNSMLARLLGHSTIAAARLLEEVGSFKDFVSFPAVRELRTQNPELLSVIKLASDFSELLYGAHIRYNLLLQERFGTRERLSELRPMWDEWCDVVRPVQARFDTDELWKVTSSVGVSVRLYTKAFIERWVRNCMSGSKEQLDGIVREQEIANKGKRARLHPEARESVPGWVGIRELDFRFTQVKVLVRDVRKAVTNRGER